MADARTHFVVAVKRHERANFLIWFDDDRDGLLTSSDGAMLLSFTTDGDARDHARDSGLVVSEGESAYFDFDELHAWIAAPNPFRLRPDDILNAWNLLGDVAHSVGNQVAHAKLRRWDRDLYNRLTACCDIPALGSPAADRPSPDDCTAIAAILRHGLACFDRVLTAPAPASAPR